VHKKPRTGRGFSELALFDQATLFRLYHPSPARAEPKSQTAAGMGTTLVRTKKEPVVALAAELVKALFNELTVSASSLYGRPVSRYTSSTSRIMPTSKAPGLAERDPNIPLVKPAPSEATSPWRLTYANSSTGEDCTMGLRRTVGSSSPSPPQLKCGCYNPICKPHYRQTSGRKTRHTPPGLAVLLRPQPSAIQHNQGLPPDV